MGQLICDTCGKEFDDPSEVRYELSIELKAVHDPKAHAKENLNRDYRSEIQAVLRELEELPLTEIQDHIHRKFRFLLCTSCQKQFIENPLPQFPR